MANNTEQGGFFAAASYVLIAEAFRHAEAGLLAPFQYLEILGATAAGYWVFGEFPDRAAWTARCHAPGTTQK